MVDKDFVKAAVVDIQRRGHALPEQIALEANILYFYFYPKFDDLGLAQGSLPAAYQLTDYTKWLTAALAADVELLTSCHTLGEFARTCEYAELEAYWLTQPGRTSQEHFDAALCKATRYAIGPGTLNGIRRIVQTYVQSVAKVVALLPFYASVEVEHTQSLNGWVASAGDFADAMLVAEAQQRGITNILANDIDLLSFDAITVYTSNPRAVAAARSAGKLLSPSDG